MNLNLLDSIYSPQDLRFLIQEIKKYSRWLSQYSIKIRVSKNKPDNPPALSELAVELLKKLSSEKQLNQAGIEELVKKLEELATHSPRITITLAGVPPKSLKQTMVDWCRKNIDPNMLVDFKFNSTLLGGMVVRYGSHVYDWSFRKQILTARVNFPEVLRRV
jgi:F0F1-type ATP synthase delta subunit